MCIRPSFSANYDLFISEGINTTCAVYVRKSLNLRPRIIKYNKDGILAIMVTLNDHALEILNIYARTYREATNFLFNHKPCTNLIMAGDFNS